jgi:uncharacterized repeat protein (TIGR03803 family)
MIRINWMTRACGVFLLWAAAAIATPAQTFTTLYSFNIADIGAFPTGALLQGTDGNYYGTTTQGGTNACFGYTCGTVFKITPEGTLTTLHSFNGTDGWWPAAALVQGSNGDFYGTTEYGGSGGDNCIIDEGCGTVFKITASGMLTSLHSFDATDGTRPVGGLVQGADGTFYGTTLNGGTYGYGTVFSVTASGTLTTLHSFGGADGAAPYAGLVQAANGMLYGTTAGGGAYNCGTVFSITPNGTLTTLHSFDGIDGSEPYAGLSQAINGDLYGTTLEGGANTNVLCADYGFIGCGTAFKITANGMLTTLYSFCSLSNCADGSIPYAGLVQATDGNLYGTTSGGGANNNVGTALRLSPSGALTTLYSFACPGTYEPFAALIQGTDGKLYGTTPYGSATTGYGYGSVFSLAVGLRKFVETQPTSGAVGAAVNILGTDLTGASSVTFNGTAAAFTVDSHSLITTTVPAGATTGTIHVVTPSGTLSSNVPFTVRRL